MQRMLIKLDDAKIERIGKYDKEEMWKVIDELFESNGCTKQPQPDGSVMYLTDKLPDDQQMAHIAVCYLYLLKQKWFAASVEEWFWFEQDEEGCDPLEEELETNEEFRKAYYQ